MNELASWLSQTNTIFSRPPRRRPTRGDERLRLARLRAQRGKVERAATAGLLLDALAASGLEGGLRNQVMTKAARQVAMKGLKSAPTTADAARRFDDEGVATCLTRVDGERVTAIREAVDAYISKIERRFAEAHAEISYGSDRFAFKEIAACGRRTPSHGARSRVEIKGEARERAKRERGEEVRGGRRGMRDGARDGERAGRGGGFAAG